MNQKFTVSHEALKGELVIAQKSLQIQSKSLQPIGQAIVFTGDSQTNHSVCERDHGIAEQINMHPFNGIVGLENGGIDHLRHRQPVLSWIDASSSGIPD